MEVLAEPKRSLYQGKKLVIKEKRLMKSRKSGAFSQNSLLLLSENRQECPTKKPSSKYQHITVLRLWQKVMAETTRQTLEGI
ncbi:hypothetical protein BOTNAR_0067g00320 [Botryotinia narcissicola]|uniref:Uncharacterized protein n=1 Tax=Botryotinia narcissicola TaxID=278944 RepID=A0A4Z1JB27_9HELO|nr:hypothetical protein BOTNAR_0067g00320 [Botryotinia narcissicola]